MDTLDQQLEEREQRFRNRLTEQQSEVFLSTSILDVKKHIIAMQKSQEQKRSLMNLSRLQTFISSMDQFWRVWQSMDTGRPELSCFIWGPLIFILRLANELSSALDATLDFYLEFGRRIPLLAQNEDVLRDSACAKKFLGYIYIDLLDFHERLLKLFAERNWKRTFSANCGDYQKSFETFITKLDLHQKFLDDLSNDNTSPMIRNFEEYRQRQGESLEAQERDRKEKGLCAMERWLSDGIDERKDHEKFQKLRSDYPETGNWILENPKVVDWIDNESPKSSLLWVNGKLGAGKTILSCRIIDHLLDQGFNAKVNYFYCRGKEVSGSNCLSLYKSLLRQFIRQNADLLPIFQARKSRDKEVLVDETQAKSLIDLSCDTRMQQYIVVDGLDELPDRERVDMVQFLVSIVDRSNDHTPGRIRLLLVSQDLPDMRKLMNPSAEILDLQVSDTKQDIEYFINKQLERLRDGQDGRDGFDLTDLEVTRARFLIRNGANGLFIYVVLVLQNLSAQSSKGDLLIELQDGHFPADLKEAYGRILNRLKNNHVPRAWETAKKIFSWLACAKRQLTWHELQAAISVFTDRDFRPYFNQDLGRLRKDIREICGSLIHVMEGERIEFIHQSAQEFILESEEIDKRAIEWDLAFLCLNYLSLDCFQAGENDDIIKQRALDGYYAFQDYAISKWMDHVETVLAGQNYEVLKDYEQGRRYQELAFHVLEQFYGVYRDEINVAGLQDQFSSLSSLTTPQGHCKEFRSYNFYDNLVGLCSSISRHQSLPSKEKDKAGFPSLVEALKRSRNVLEDMFEHPGTTADLDDLVALYGERIYKCDRLRCKYFYEGFDKVSERDNHLNRHDRPFLCPVEGCSMIPFGFSTNRDQEKHIRNYHPHDSDQPPGFRRTEREAPANGRFTCDICSRSFTRYANLEGHKNSHLGQRPYACTTCGRGFARMNDRRRHEKVHRRR